MIVDLAIYAGCFLMLVGAAFCLLASVGVLRLPDLLTRMHAASKAGAVGGGLILLAVAVLSFDPAVAVRAIIGVVFILITTPLSAHLLARASYGADYAAKNNIAADEMKSKSGPN
ncbi:cation:proton antiporter [Devosia epidermidihirudinis]|uniref:Cation:proton antiporter n=1 Tax=Devosia epidermidihirudinis TaxID=1293439 RepID=A0A0F5QGF7_9HYPH|nr:monovalent cation/H(+) antiporter subunit G [Devosia epidermidihirudinis]KKC39836.1 cation:proton antiporter [Devosia epidermidihirudinis]